MWKELKTERLVIRQLIATDFNSFHKINSDPKVMEFIKNGKQKTEGGKRSKNTGELAAYPKAD